LSLWALLSLLFFLCLAGLPGCSSLKAVARPKQPVTDSNAALISKGQDEVKAKLGEPTIVSKTNEGHTLWIYKPSWKLMPNDKGTMYVEFEEGKVIKIFRKQ